MNSRIIKKPSVSIGIPTYEAGESLVMVLDSIYKQSRYVDIKEIIVAVDGKRIQDNIEAKIKNSKLRVVPFKFRKGQAQRINDICRLAKTDILVIVNDDVLLSNDAVKNMLKYGTEYDLMTSTLDVIKPKSFFQKTLEVGKDINLYLFSHWNKGDNYLSCNGRFIALSNRLYKVLKVPEKIWNNDAYIYLFAKQNLFKVIYAEDVVASYQLPGNFNEHFKQSNKFQKSLIDNQRYFSKSLKHFYNVPFKYTALSFISSFKRKPFITFCYLTIFLLTRFITATKKNTLAKQGFWETDKSTKLGTI